MKFYFTLQYQRFSRIVQDAGMNPYIGFLISIAVFVVFTYSTFLKIPYPQYVYSVIALGVINILGKSKRNEFLKNAYSVTNYKKIRGLENLFLILPFVISLMLYQHYLIGLGVLLIALLLSFYNKINSFQFVIPTPFYKHPFEFVIGFRKTFFMFFIAYTLSIISISVGNFNLGIFALLVVFFTSLNYYTKPEPFHYVWVHKANAVAFLKTKIKLAILQSLLLSAPIVVLLIVFNLDKTHFVLLFELVGILYVLTALLGKYAYYPSEVNLVQGFTIMFSILFPPLLLIIIPVFYNQAKQRLTPILS